MKWSCGLPRMGKPRNSEAPKGSDFRRREYKREFSMYVDVKDNKVVKARDVIEAVQDLCGEGSLYGCVKKSGNMYEITVKDDIVKNFLIDGLCCNGKTYDCTPVINDRMLVSFLDLPTYMPNWEIEQKLDNLNVELISPINRKCYQGTEVEDGTRMCTVKLPADLRSLPYVMKLSDGHTTSNYRVVHDNQIKMCHNCFSTTHIYRDCPEVTCFRCKSKGHFKWQCKANRCGLCYKFDCNCRRDDETEGQTDIHGGQNEKDETESPQVDVDKVIDDDTDGNETERKTEDDITEEISDDDICEQEDSETTDDQYNDDDIRQQHDAVDVDGEWATTKPKTHETLFGDVMVISGNTAETTVANTQESPSAELIDSNERESDSVEMCSPLKQRKRQNADDTDTHAADSLPHKLRIQSPGKKK